MPKATSAKKGEKLSTPTMFKVGRHRTSLKHCVVTCLGQLPCRPSLSPTNCATHPCSSCACIHKAVFVGSAPVENGIGTNNLNAAALAIKGLNEVTSLPAVLALLSLRRTRARHIDLRRNSRPVLCFVFAVGKVPCCLSLATSCPPPARFIGSLRCQLVALHRRPCLTISLASRWRARGAADTTEGVGVDRRPDGDSARTNHPR